MDEALEERIRYRAREIWEQAGCPDHRSEEFWLQAEKEILGETPAHDESSASPVAEVSDQAA